MGQKTHPLGFRLGIIQNHKSQWYANYRDYKKILEEDEKIRQYLSKILNEYSISNIEINRNTCYTQTSVNIAVGKFNVKTKVTLKTKEKIFKEIIEKMEKKFKKWFPLKQIPIINIQEVEICDAGLLADFIVNKLEQRIPYRRVIQDAITHKYNRCKYGYKIQISGRLNGADIARKEWMRKRRVPLHTLKADIDYASQEAHTIYGVLGIKVWLFKGELISNLVN